jgi:hypothetical protein
MTAVGVALSAQLRRTPDAVSHNRLRRVVVALGDSTAAE